MLCVKSKCNTQYETTKWRRKKQEAEEKHLCAILAIQKPAISTKQRPNETTLEPKCAQKKLYKKKHFMRGTVPVCFNV